MKRISNHKHNSMRGRDRFYCALALFSGVLLFVGMLLIEQSTVLGLGGLFCFCLACSAALFFSLLKLHALEFRAGSFWDRVSRRVDGSADLSEPGYGAACLGCPARHVERAGRYPGGYRNAA